MSTTSIPRIALISRCDVLAPGFQRLCDDLNIALTLLQHVSEFSMVVRLGMPVTVIVTDEDQARATAEHAVVQRVPVVVVSSGMEQAVSLFRDKRIAGVLPIPLARCMVAAMVTTMLDKKRYFPQVMEAMGTRLTRREHEVYQLQLQGHSNGEIASLLHLEYETVTRYERRIRAQLHS